LPGQRRELDTRNRHEHGGSVLAAPDWHATASTSAYRAGDADAYDAFEEFLPGERIGPPPAGRGGKAAMRGGLLILMMLGGGWALLGDQATWPGWLTFDPAAVLPAPSRDVAKPVEASASVAATAAPPALVSPPPAQLPTAPSKASDTQLAQPPVAALTTAALPPATTGSAETPAQPLPPPAVDPADPYQKRAAAVGLHPGLSRVLLERLSPADYRNAAIAIQTAVAETPDGEVFVWPRQRKPELALFQVRFVPGAAPDCRRYVVAVTKDGWLTTAMPMEKCGAQSRRSRRG